MSSNPCRVELGVHSTSAQSRTWTKNNIYAMFLDHVYNKINEQSNEFI